MEINSYGKNTGLRNGVIAYLERLCLQAKIAILDYVTARQNKCRV
jgi:hypothetical protein